MNNLEKTEKLKNIINNWIRSYNPTHLLTFRLPKHIESDDFDISQRVLKKVMSAFEYRLLGRHWHKKHLPFIVASEKGHGIAWHYHILFNQQNFSEDELQTAIFKTTVALKYPFYSLELDLITEYKDYVITYCTKEIKVKHFDTSESDKIIPSHALFDIPAKRQLMELEK